MKKTLFWLLFLFTVFAQPNHNGMVDNIYEMAWRKQYMIPMSDNVRLATDVYLPIFQEDLVVFNVSVNVLGTTLTAPMLKMANAGTQYYLFEGEPDPKKLPIILTRTPYNKGDSTALTEGYFYALLGYAGALQDMRGHYASEGTYLPMFSDGWAKDPYIAPLSHPLDITPNKEANFHQDGYETLLFLADSLRFDTDGNGILTSNDSLICNGKIGMFGASALGNSQFQAAAVAKVPALKCLFPVVASGEFYNSAGHPNGAFREMLINGWLRGQVEFYPRWDTSSVANPKDAIHTVADYGVSSPREAAEVAIDFWTTLNKAHYPYSDARAVMDISHAPLDTAGNSAPNGNISRYTLLDVPVYNLTGWWDIFIDGQINTWQLLSKNVAQTRKNQKIVIGPWAHQTITQIKTGEVTYKENVGDVIGAAVNLDASDPSVIPKIANSEIIKWFRQWLGVPTFTLPPLQEWQYLGNVLGDSIFIKVPSDTFKTSFDNFINFLNGTQGISGIPFTLKGPLLDTNQTHYLNLPATGVSLFLDTSGTVVNTALVNFDTIPRVRFYLVGPIDDTVAQNANLGNYWFAADTFPIPNITRQKVFLHANKTLDTLPPTTDEGLLQFVANPMNPVRTIGGNNMIVKTPDNSKNSQGQMNLADPKYDAFTMNVPLQSIPGQQGLFPSVLQFTSGAIIDSFSIIGNTYISLFAKSKPVTGVSTDSTDCDFIVRFLDVYPDGREMFVFEGVVNARGREYAKSFVTNDGVYDDKAPWSNILADKIYEFTFPALPIAYTWGHNHKIKILISSTNYPRYQANPNLPMMPDDFFRKAPLDPATYNYYGTPMSARIALQSIAFAPNYPTSIEFPVFGKKLETTPASSIVLKENEIQVRSFPNPVTETLHLEFSRPVTANLTLTDLRGKTLATFSLHRQKVAEIPFSHYASGMYFLSIEQGGARKTLKILRR